MTKWYNSKTVWLNLITGALALIALPDFISLIPPATLPYTALGSSILNWILRVYFTSTPIG